MQMVEAVKEGVERHKAMVRDGVRESRKLEWWKVRREVLSRLKLTF